LKLLVDENLAPELAEQIADLFPGSVHVTAVGLGSTSDTVIWEYAAANQFAFLTKDKDFVNLSLTLGSPPKVVLLQTGNCSTSQIERIIRSNAVRLSEFDNDGRRSLLLLR
jgi:predicted nuclease of predicted toxin-antitoxin system